MSVFILGCSVGVVCVCVWTSINESKNIWKLVSRYLRFLGSGAAAAAASAIRILAK